MQTVYDFSITNFPLDQQIAYFRGIVNTECRRLMLEYLRTLQSVLAAMSELDKQNAMTTILSMIETVVRYRKLGPFSHEGDTLLLVKMLILTHPTVGDLIRLLENAIHYHINGVGLLYPIMTKLPHWDKLQLQFRAEYMHLADLYYCAYVRDESREAIIRGKFISAIQAEENHLDSDDKNHIVLGAVAAMIVLAVVVPLLI